VKYLVPFGLKVVNAVVFCATIYKVRMCVFRTRTVLVNLRTKTDSTLGITARYSLPTTTSTTVK